ncbi:tyrosine-type recombinase/integrase [Alicyclobacillus macrosporangiidus]|uniref:tyrosine-type recombinase/integrase n=1 Tax=Alicyclobacillus macrosporangiidus TaxID=392015 RepID=UPI000495595F|nr:tyrosine-type recombinase/integrase [Alicyclobacillus macrosporangiidus]
MSENFVAQLNAFFSYLRDKGKSENTVRNYTRTLMEFDRWLNENGGEFDRLTRLDVQQFINHLRENGNVPTTVKNKFACLCTYAHYIKRSDIVEDIRVPDVRPVHNIAPKSLERNERNRLLREVERDGNLRDIAMTYMLLMTGLRVSELVALDRDDVTMSERSGSVLVRNGKGNVSRKVPMFAEVRLHLRRYLEQRKDSEPALFLSNRGQRISVRAVQHTLAKYGVHPHELRHTFVRELVSKGIDISTVAELAGHRDINVTRRYSMPTESELERAIERAFS